jgi:geranylgeranyl pyrophosphate synthase
VSQAQTTPFEEVLEAGGQAIRRAMDQVESELTALTAAYGDELAHFAGDTLSAGGKRLRPLLVFVCGAPGSGGNAGRAALVRAGSAVELVHMATLVHDDVVDGAEMRRGHPTVYATAGRAAAMATGDFLFSRAFALLESNRDREQVRVLSNACLALARGELVQREDAYASSVDVERYLLRCELKTASLFSAACRLGALASRRDAEHVHALGRFGDRIGVAFQILDDVLDATGPVERTGKERGSDLLEGTTTLPLILAAEEDPRLGTLDLRSLQSRGEAERICNMIAATDAVERSRARAWELVGEAKAELSSFDGELSALLRLVADRVVTRYS